MHISSLFALTAFAQLISGYPSPASSPQSLTPRRQTSHNDPHRLAGNPPTARSAADVPNNARSPPGQVWRDPHSSTSVSITLLHALPANTVSNVLSTAIERVFAHIGVLGDGNIPGGVYQYVNEGLRIYTQNTNNHQQTWGVLKAALELLKSFMEEGPGAARPGAALLQIYDGVNEVARGVFGNAGALS